MARRPKRRARENASKRSWGSCGELEGEDLLGLCRDFSPSYDVSRLSGSPDPTALFQAISGATGIPVEQLDLSMRLDKDLQLEAENIDDILRAAGLPLFGESVDLNLFIATNTIADLLNLNPPDPRQVYLDQVERCRGLVGDEEAFRAAGCKRLGHMMLPGGRAGFVRGDLSKYEPRPETFARWEEDLPPLDARTQSLASQAWARRGSSVVGTLAGDIRRGLDNYARSAGDPSGGVFIPFDPGLLVAAGVPPKAARMLSENLGGREIPQVGTHQRNLLGALSMLFGGFPLVFGELEAHFDMADPRGEVRAARGSVRRMNERMRGSSSRPGQGLLGRARRSRTQRLLLQGARVEKPPGLIIPLDLTSEGAFLEKLTATTKKAKKWTLVLELGDRQAPITLRLQHSDFDDLPGIAGPPDYTTLQGFNLSELPFVLARKIVSPRRKREGRRRPPLPSAKTNPVATYILPPEVADMEPGSWTPYTLGAKVVVGDPNASSGKVVYLSMKPGAVPKVVSARRVAAWLNIAIFGHDISEISGSVRGKKVKPLIPALRGAVDRRTRPGSTVPRRAGRPEIASSGLPRSQNSLPTRNNPMANRNNSRRNPGALYLSSDSALNKYTDYYYPGTLWNYREEGEFGPSEAPPVNRRNPSPRKQSKRSRDHRARHHEGKLSTQAMRLYQKNKHQGMTLKMAWAEVKSGARNNPTGYSAQGRTRVQRRPYWPRQSEYAQLRGPYSTASGSTPLPPNRRNPRRAGPTVGSWPKACPFCGRETQGTPIAVSNSHRGPRGGKVWGHVGCV